MKYMGSKAKIAEYIVPIIQSHIAVSGSRTYIEPFCGGCNVIDKVQAKNRIAADKNKYLIALFRHLQESGGLPYEITKEEYDKARDNMAEFPAWYIGRLGSLHRSTAGFLTEDMLASGERTGKHGITIKRAERTFCIR